PGCPRSTPTGPRRASRPPRAPRPAGRSSGYRLGEIDRRRAPREGHALAHAYGAPFGLSARLRRDLRALLAGCDDVDLHRVVPVRQLRLVGDDPRRLPGGVAEGRLARPVVARSRHRILVRVRSLASLERAELGPARID